MRPDEYTALIILDEPVMHFEPRPSLGVVTSEPYSVPSDDL